MITTFDINQVCNQNNKVARENSSFPSLRYGLKSRVMDGSRKYYTANILLMICALDHENFIREICFGAVREIFNSRLYALRMCTVYYTRFHDSSPPFQSTVPVHHSSPVIVDYRVRERVRKRSVKSVCVYMLLCILCL